MTTEEPLSEQKVSNSIPLEQIGKELYEVLADKALKRGCACETVEHGECEYLYSRGLSHYFLKDGEKIIDASIRRIIGHEPTLNDVLLKLGKELRICEFRMEDWGDDEIHFMADGAAFEWLNYLFEEGFVNFTWKSGGLDNQTEETLRKLYSLLIK